MSDSFSDDDDLFNDPETLARADQVEKIHVQATQGAGGGTLTGLGGAITTTVTAATNTNMGPRKTSMAVPAIYASRSIMRDRLGTTRMLSTGNGNRNEGVKTMMIPGTNVIPSTNLAPRPLTLSHHHHHHHPPSTSHTKMEIEDMEEYPEISVTEDGKYVVASLQSGDNDTEQPIAGPSRPPVPALPILSKRTVNEPLTHRRPLSRSISMNVQSQSSHPRTHQGSQSISHLPPPHETTGRGLQFPLRPFTRTVSAATEKRRAVIEMSLGMNSGGASQVVERLEVGNEGRKSVVMDDEMSFGSGSRDQGREESLVVAMEALKKQVEEQRKLAEEKAQKVQVELYQSKGEVEHVRVRLEEQKKNHQLIERTMRSKIDEMQENIKQEQEKHKREMEAVMTAHVFKNHNILTSASKARHPGSSQRPTASQAIHSTPTRHQSMAIGFGGGFGNHNRIPMITPLKSPTNNKRNQSMGVPLGGAFGDGDASDKGFVTPLVPYKKFKKVKEDHTPIATTPFKGLQNSFLGDSAVAAGRAAKRLKPNLNDSDITQTPSKSGAIAAGLVSDGDPTSSPQVESDVDMGWHGEAVEMQQDDVQMQEDDEEIETRVFLVDPDDKEVKNEILRVVFDHVSPASIPTSGEPPLRTVQKILNLQLSDEDSEEVKQMFSNQCAELLSFFGKDPTEARFIVGTAFTLLWSLAQLVSWIRETAAQLDVLESIFSLLADLAHQVHIWQEAFIFTTQLQFLLPRIAEVYLPAPPVAAIGNSKSNKDALRRKLKQVVDNASGRAVPAGEGHPTNTEPLADVRSRLGQTFCRFVATYCGNPRLGDVIDEFIKHPTGLPLLLQTYQPFDVVSEAIELAYCRACDAYSFRALLSSPGGANDPERDMTRPPVVDILCRYLLDAHPLAPSTRSTTLIRLKIIHFFSMLAAQSHDAVLILGETYYLVPTLVKAMERESEVIWGLTDNEDGLEGPFTLLIGIVSLLHYLVFPVFPPEMSLVQLRDNDPPTGIDLLSKLRSSMPSASTSRGPAAKEFNGLHHMFIVAIGRISYADCDEEVGKVGGWGDEEVRALQYLAQDLLESVVEGPEGDSIYEVYVNSVPDGTEDALAEVEAEARKEGDDKEIEVIDLLDDEDDM